MVDTQTLAALGIDAEEGLAYCADDPEFYEEMLGEYVAEAGAGLDELDRAYAGRDWQLYGIRAHSIKSTSRMIGATAFSELAREMELAAREGRAGDIDARHAPFVAGYRQLVGDIRKVLG